MDVAYRLSLANAGLCLNALAPQPGFVLHTLDQYDLPDRQEAARNFALGTHVGVMAVVAGSPAQRSGLAADDQLISVNGRALPGAVSRSSPTSATVDLARNILAEEMAKGEVVLRIFRESGFQDVRFTAEIGCAVDAELMTGGEVNAWADGQRVVISDGILARCATDGDLALVIAHELAHNLLHHSQRLADMGLGSRKFALSRTGLAGSREKEEEADQLGVRLASAAGYDLSDVLVFLNALLDANGVDRPAGTHPATAKRLDLVRAEIAAEGLKRSL